MKNYDQKLKERVIADYQSGGGVYHQLQGQYGISFQLIHQWVQDFKGTSTKSVKLALIIRYFGNTQPKIANKNYGGNTDFLIKSITQKNKTLQLSTARTPIFALLLLVR